MPIRIPRLLFRRKKIKRPEIKRNKRKKNGIIGGIFVTTISIEFFGSKVFIKSNRPMSERAAITK